MIPLARAAWDYERSLSLHCYMHQYKTTFVNTLALNAFFSVLSLHVPPETNQLIAHILTALNCLIALL